MLRFWCRDGVSLLSGVCGVHLLKLLLVFQPPTEDSEIITRFEVQLSVKNSEEDPL